jgi:malate dehydrogenase (oxaloacetate-decarboxylating)(NADP+)
MNLDKSALNYHSAEPAGKVSVSSPKPCNTEYELSLAYSPGVAAPCKEIAKETNSVYDYTSKGNLVAVISNGTAVLGLGNIGPEASKPVMEGKGNLFKMFAGIDVFDIELNNPDVDSFCQTVKALEPTFGGINLEDIKAPECFEIEKRLKEEMNIPVFHDDQHGTAIISGAALLNAAEITKRKMRDIKMVINGAGAAAVACGRLFVGLGVKQENITMCDSKGVIYKGRQEGMNPYKQEFAVETSDRTLSDAVKGSDCFVGLSVAGAMTVEMLMSMNKNPIVFAMANPDPEINPEVAKKARADVIMATGRSDFPNQVNNVLGFPSIFRGALDARASQINEEMKLAAVNALADLAKEDVPEKVSEAYGGQQFSFGPDYIIPKPFDPRVIMTVAPAVAKAAQDSGVAQKPIKNMKAYVERLEALQGNKVSFIRSCINRVKSNSRKSKIRPRIVFPEGTTHKVLKACDLAVRENVMTPILLGREDHIKATIRELGLDSLKKVQIIEPRLSKNYDRYANELYKLKQRRGITDKEARRMMMDTNYYAAMAVQMGDAEGMITGATQKYKDAVVPILKVIGTGNRRTASGMNIVLKNEKMFLFTDTAVNVDPTAEQVANTAIHASAVAQYFKMKPKIAMLSYSNFTSRGPNPEKMQKAARLVKEQFPDFIVDGEMQADTAVNSEIVDRIFPFCDIKDGANILVFPNLDSGNISYKLVQQIGDCEVVGPFLLGVNKPAHVVQRTSVVDDIFNTIVMTCLHYQAIPEISQ